MSERVIVVPKNSGLKEYRQKAMQYIEDADSATLLEVRAEDIPYWVSELEETGKNAVGFIGEDLYNEYCIRNNKKPPVLKKIQWVDPTAKFGKPTLCLLGPKGKKLEDLNKKLAICIAKKYKAVAKNYLASLEAKGYQFRKIYRNGSAEACYTQGITQLIIDIVYTGASLKKYGLEVYDQIMQSDFLIIGGSNENQKITIKA